MQEQMTPADVLLAAERGWRICDVYDAQTRRWHTQIAPTRESKNQDTYRLMLAVVAAARAGDALSIRALRLIAARTVKPRKKTR